MQPQFCRPLASASDSTNTNDRRRPEPTITTGSFYHANPSSILAIRVIQYIFWLDTGGGSQMIRKLLFITLVVGAAMLVTISTVKAGPVIIDGLWYFSDR